MVSLNKLFMERNVATEVSCNGGEICKNVCMCKILNIIYIYM